MVRVLAVDGRVVRQRHHLLRVLPGLLLLNTSTLLHNHVPVRVLALHHTPVKLNLVLNVLSLDLPRRSVRQPVLGVLHLIPLLVDLLVKDAVVVADPVAGSGNASRRERVQVARGQTT